MTDRNEGAGNAGARTVTIAGKPIPIENVGARKANVAFQLLKRVTRRTEDLTAEWDAAIAGYRVAHTDRLSRVQARVEYPPRPIITPEGDLKRDADGELVYQPSIVDRMTEADWEASGNVLEVPRNPQPIDLVPRLLPKALDAAEEDVYALLTLFTMTNEAVKMARKSEGGIKAELQKRCDDLLDDAMFDELMELAVVVAETVDDQFRRKAEELGERLGKIGGLIGLNRDSTSSTLPDGPDSPPLEPTSLSSPNTTPTSSTDSPAPTPDGAPKTSSTPNGISSSHSADDSTTTPNGTPPHTVSGTEALPK